MDNQLDRVVDALPGVAWTASADGSVDYVNQGWCTYTGCTREAALRAGWQTVVHPEDRRSVGDSWQHSVRTGEPFRKEQRIRRADGVYRWFVADGLPMRDEQGRITRWWVIHVDIDEQKRDKALIAQALAEVSASEDRLRDIIDAVPGFVWSAAPDGDVYFINRRWCDYTGMTLEQATGIGWTASIHPDDTAALGAYWYGLLQSGEAGEYEARLRRYDGVYRWFMIRAVPQRDESGQLVRWYGENTDIEDRKRAEMLLSGEKHLLGLMAGGSSLTEILEALCELLEATFDGCVGSILLVDQQRRYPEPRPTPRLLPGAAPHVPADLIPDADGHPVDSAPCPAGIAATDNHQVIVADLNLENRWPHWCVIALSHGFRANWSAPVRSANGEVCGILSMHYRRPGTPSAAQQNLIAQFTHLASIAIDRASNEAALGKVRSELAHLARVASLSTLTASIAHEVNQPLAGIITNASTCLRMLGADPPNVSGALETARRTIRDGNRASDVINRLRALFSKKSITIENVDLNEAAREVIAMLLGELQRNGVLLHPDFVDDLPAVKGDRVQLQQVILNLILNATEAMNKITSRSRHMQVMTGHDATLGVYLAVRDNGPGFDTQDAEQLFNAFYTTKSSGMGIGLSVSRSIIENHEGRLWASLNDDGPGATFRFALAPLPDDSSELTQALEDRP
ncbi:PAS domain-containing protein [Pseudomonas sp. NPDC090202]|uniref:PAS domain-containing protein n=1 Tax=unclassified Pseudomonas TaxID=196821 RepID=UPI003827B364